MEGQQKRAAVAARCLLVIVLLLAVQQQQVAAKSAFCRCYERCRNGHHSRFLCGINCLRGGSNGPLAAGGCGVICSGLSLCGTVAAAAPADDVQACVADCTKNLRAASAPATAAKIN